MTSLIYSSYLNIYFRSYFINDLSNFIQNSKQVKNFPIKWKKKLLKIINNNSLITFILILTILFIFTLFFWLFHSFSCKNWPILTEVSLHLLFPILSFLLPNIYIFASFWLSSSRYLPSSLSNYKFSFNRLLSVAFV